MTLERAIQSHVRRDLNKHEGNVRKTCKELAISRAAFYAWAREWNWLGTDGRLCAYLVKRNGWKEKAERRRAIAGCGQKPVRYFGETDMAFAERMADADGRPWG